MVHERDSSQSSVLENLPVEFGVEQRNGAKTQLWSATCTWANGAVSCVLRERERGSIEAEGPLFAVRFGRQRVRTGHHLRADAIEWAVGLLGQLYDWTREHGPAATGTDEETSPSGLTLRHAIAIIRKRRLHERGENGVLSKSQARKNERILAILSVIFPSDKLVESISQSDVHHYQSVRQGDHLEWEMDAGGNIRRGDLGERLLRRSAGRGGRAGKPQTPYSVIFPKSFGRRNLPPVEEVTATSELRDLQTMLNRLLRERDASGKPYLTRNPLVGLHLGRFEKRKLEPATVDRYRWTMQFADAAVDGMARQYPHHTYVPGMLRCMLAIAFHTAHRISAICALRTADLLLDHSTVQTALGRMRVTKGEERIPRSWADHWPHGAIHWRADVDKEDYDRVIPINSVLREELRRYLAQRDASGISTEWLFPRPLCPTTCMLDYDARDILYAAEALAREAIAAEGLAPDGLIPEIADRAFHAYRALWEILRDDLGWSGNKNAAYAGGWTTQVGGAQQVSYNRLKPHFVQAVVDGRSVREVLDESVETQRARAAVRSAAPG